MILGSIHTISLAILTLEKHTSHFKCFCKSIIVQDLLLNFAIVIASQVMNELLELTAGRKESFEILKIRISLQYYAKWVSVACSKIKAVFSSDA